LKTQARFWAEMNPQRSTRGLDATAAGCAHSRTYGCALTAACDCTNQRTDASACGDRFRGPRSLRTALLRELIGLQRVTAAIHGQRSKFECELRTSGEAAGILHLDDFSLHRCARRNS
jgi:hypothetical protein